MQGPAEGGPPGHHRHPPQEEEHQGEQRGGLGRPWTRLPGRHELDRTAEGLDTRARDVSQQEFDLIHFRVH